MRKIVFTKKFATKEKGDTLSCDSIQANQLVKVDKVAKYVDVDIQAQLEKAAKIEEKREAEKRKATEAAEEALKALNAKRYKENAKRHKLREQARKK